MNQAVELPQRQRLCIGPDRVTLDAHQVVVDSPSPREGWEDRPFRKPRIHFRNQAWEIASVTPQPGLGKGGHRYTLRPWPEDRNDLPGAELAYDRETAHRCHDRWARAQRIERYRFFTWLTYPLVGFAWWGVKRRLRDAWDIDPLIATRVSVWAETGLFLQLMALMAINGFTNLFGGVLLPPLLILLFDLLGRGMQFYGDDPKPYGFLEWLLHIKM
ncbi:MAG: hypothetical protein AAF533_11635 [Acidobacteriota bacterium]